jgi:diguanylate cyclase (GGDEF)-like protein
MPVIKKSDELFWEIMQGGHIRKRECQKMRGMEPDFASSYNRCSTTLFWSMQPLTMSVSRPYRDHDNLGLRNSHRRSLIRMVFLAAAFINGLFLVLEFVLGNYLIAAAELVMVGLLVLGASRVKKTPHLRRWIYAFLVSTFTFIILIMLIHKTSDTVFVWVFIMPVVSYLLLGQKEGFLLAAPFMVGHTACNVMLSGGPDDAREVIEMLNPIVCGLTLLGFIHVYENMRAKAETRLMTLAQTDALTGLPNRSSFHTTLERSINEARRNGNSFALALMDIDHFKAVNDSLGHDAGDEALRHIAQALNQRLRTTDFVGRLGGEEFGIILRDVDHQSARLLVDELRQRIADSVVCYEQRCFDLTVTFGLSIWPQDASTLTTLYRNADQRLYMGKAQGRNRVIASSTEGLSAAERGSSKSDARHDPDTGSGALDSGS